MQDFARSINGGFWGSNAKYYQHMAFARLNVNALNVCTYINKLFYETFYRRLKNLSKRLITFSFPHKKFFKMIDQ